MKILFVRSEKAFLPEIEAYINYFNKRIGWEAHDSSKLNPDYDIDEFDVIWEFKGFNGIKTTDKVLVHEYASSSTGIFPKFKNFLKVNNTYKPDIRIFLNERVQNEFKFTDTIDCSFRDMGIDEIFLKKYDAEKEFDSVYVGSVGKDRGMDKFLESFTSKPNGTICLIGNVDNDIYRQYKDNNNIMFTGKVPYKQVPEIASKAVYGINFIPDKYPFNLQTSTKLLEYLSLNLKVVTTDYEWVKTFEKQHRSSFYKLNYRNIDFDLNKIEKFSFESNFNPKEFLWEKVIEQSQIEKKLINTLKQNSNKIVS